MYGRQHFTLRMLKSHVSSQHQLINRERHTLGMTFTLGAMAQQYCVISHIPQNHNKIRISIVHIHQIISTYFE